MDADVEMGPASIPDMSFTIRPMPVDPAEFAHAGFATAEDFEPDHFDEPEEAELLAQRIVAAPHNPFPGPSNLPQHQPPSNDHIQASLASVREQLQVLVLNDAARRLEIDEVRQAAQASTSRLDNHDLTIKDLQAMYANLMHDHNRTKTQLDEAVTQLSDFIRYFTEAQQSTAAASHSRMSGLQHYTNSPDSSALRALAQETFTGIFSQPPSIRLQGGLPLATLDSIRRPSLLPPAAFDSASHSGPAHHPLANRPFTRRAASNILPQTEVASGTTRAKMPLAASASPKKGKGKGDGKAKWKGKGDGKAKGKGKGKQKLKAEGKGKGKARTEDDEDIVDDDHDDHDDEDHDDIENTE